MRKVGDRVIAILGSDGRTVKSFGEGVYAGDFPLPDYARGLNFGQYNPRIDLDNGKTVWGCECWWGSVESVQKRFAGLAIEMIDPDVVFERPKGEIAGKVRVAE